jgi:heme-degrading monooxygenase HmoA
MKVRVWQYDVAQESNAEFEREYGRHGSWVRLFARSDGFLGTELYRSADTPGRYITVDMFDTDADWEQFLADHGAAYRELDARLAGLTLRENELAS